MIRLLSLIFIVFVFNTFEIKAHCLVAGYAQPLDSITLQAKAKKLKQLYLLSTSSSKEASIVYKEQFFIEFPQTFNQLLELYGYNDNKPAVLYFEGENHILKLFNNLDNINDTLYYKKIISIAIGGHWDADAVNYFQYGLRKRVLNDPELTVYILKDKSEKDIKSFWFFYFDGAHPQKQIVEQLLKIRYINSNIYDLMIEAHNDVLKQSH